MPTEEDARALGRSDFWDARYAKSDGEVPTHEWFRDFDALEPFFQKYLFEERGEEGKAGRVLHLGSGDSVSHLQPSKVPSHVASVMVARYQARPILTKFRPYRTTS